MVYNPISCAVASICFLVASWVFTGVRLYVRVHLRKAPFLDDVFAVASLMLFTVNSIIFTYCQFKGYIPLAMYPSPVYGREGLRLFFICDMLYSVGTYLMKLSFTCTLLRLLQTRAQYFVIFAVMTSGAIITVSTMIHAALFCKPTSYHWNGFDNPDASGHCDVFWSRMLVSLIQAVWIMIADFVLGLVIPFLLLRGLLMHFRTKLSIRFLLGIGSIASIATILRIVYLSIALNPNITSTIVPMAFWSIIEQGISILCVAASTWKPLFLKLGLVDSRDNHDPVRLNAQDGEIFHTTESDSSTRTGWNVPLVRIFYDKEKKRAAAGVDSGVVRRDGIMLSSGSSRGVSSV
ncbi:hypothetical protein BJX76DRAFT_364670 [Aspergillus varians]